MANLSALQVCVLVVGIMCPTLCWAQAPGDEETRCTVQHSSPPTYPDTERNLMDSYNYEDLVPGNGTGSIIATAVWNDYSFDGNDVDGIVAPTYWQQLAGGLCRFQARVCGWRQNGVVVAQDNWLFTQHIRQDFNSTTYDYDVTIRVYASYSGPNCRERNRCKQRFNLLHYFTNTPQLPSTEGSGYMNRENYQRFVQPTTLVTTSMNTYSFTLPPSSTGFYIAVQDIGSCLTLSRLRVYRNNCKSRQIGLVKYPSAPPPTQPANISTTCVANADHVGSENTTCTSDGTWGPENPVCQCRPGYVENSAGDIQCRACPAGQYRSEEDTECQSCPANTVVTVVAAPVCQCVNGYFRNTESLTHPNALQFVEDANEKPSNDCTKPPTVPPRLSVVAVTPREIEVNWSPPANDGGRTDLYYQVEISDPEQLGEFEKSDYLTSTSYTFVVRPFTKYCVRVTAHNGVSDQDPDGTHLRRAQNCTETPEDLPGVVGGVEGHCSVVVWDRPREPNGIIANYTILFFLNVGNDSGVVMETDSDITHFEIESLHQLPLIPQGGSPFVKVLAHNGAGKGSYSDPVYIGCEDPPGTCTNGSSPHFPPTVPEPVTDVLREGNVLYWSRPSGRISLYILTVSDEESGMKMVDGLATNEQFVTLPSGSSAKISVEVCTELDGVQGDCTVHELVSEAESSEEGGVDSQLMVIALCAGCGGTALLVGLLCLMACAIHHWKFRKQFGPNKEALTWEAYNMKTTT